VKFNETYYKKGGEKKYMQPKIYVDKFKIHPSDNQVSLFNSFINNKRFIYNYQVAAYINSLKNKKDINIRQLRDNYRKDLKNGNIKLKDDRLINDEFRLSLANTPSQISDMTNEDIMKAIKDVKKNKNKKTKKPSILKFRKKSNDKRSFTIHLKCDTNFKYNHITNTLKIVKVDEPLKLNTRFFHYFTGNEKIKRITISNTNYGWYISITYEIRKLIKQYPHNNTAIGIDWGIKHFSTDSNNKTFTFNKRKKIVNYKKYDKMYNKIKKMDFLLASKKLYNKEYYKSNRYQTLKTKRSYLYERLANIRRNFLHHVSTHYMKNYDHIIIEGLKPSNMNKNHRLARKINESMFYTWKVFLQYKTKLYDKSITLVNPRNTSQTCSKCGHIKKDKNKLKLNDNIFKCNKCNLKINRDYNAAKNILSLGLM